MTQTEDRAASVGPVPRSTRSKAKSTRQPAYDLVRDRLVSATGYTGHERGGKLSTRCPAHEDRQASLSVRRADDRVLLHCFAGCRLDDVLAELELTKRDLFDQTGKRWRKPWVPAKPPGDPGWTYVTEPPDLDEHTKRMFYIASTLDVSIGHHPGGPVAPW